MGWVVGTKDGKVTLQSLAPEGNSPETLLTPDEARDLARQMEKQADKAEGGE